MFKTLLKMFGFPESKYKCYSKNFLKTVIFQIGFEENEHVVKKKDEIVKLFAEAFPKNNETTSRGVQISFNSSQTPVFQELNEDTGVELRSNDGQQLLHITKNNLTFTISGKSYQDFNQIKTGLDNISAFFKLCFITSTNRIAVRKLNIIEFLDEGNAIDVLKQLINNELLGNVNHFPSPKFINLNLQNLNYSNDGNNLYLKYGLNKTNSGQSNIGQIIADIDLFNSEKNDTNDVLEIGAKINKEVFNIFNWVMSSEAIKILN